MSGKLLGLHAQTPLHPGSGTALGTVDLPIQRERHTKWPTIPGSALKGILRDACREYIAQQPDLQARDRWDDQPGDDAAKRSGRRVIKSNRALADATLDLNLLFGPPTAGAGEFAGALSITDARILAFPVRSAKGVFAWVSCPAALDRLQRDAKLIGKTISWEVPNVSERGCVCAEKSPCLGAGEVAVLEELDFKRDPGGQLDAISTWIADELLRPEFTAARSRFPKHFLMLPDDDFTHFVRHATEVTARIALDYETKTVKNGALFYQEFLPAETILYSVVLASDSRSARQPTVAGDPMKQLSTFLNRDVLQVGGDESTGKGLCAIRLT